MSSRRRIRVVKPVKVDGLSTLDKLAKITAKENGWKLERAYRFIQMQQELRRVV